MSNATLELLRFSGESSELHFTVAADLFESVLAALFLSDRNGEGAQMVIDVLNHARLPFPTTSDPWFSALGPCIKEGFPFDAQLEAIFLCSETLTPPQRNVMRVLETLHCERNRALELLLSCAFLDHSGDDGPVPARASERPVSDSSTRLRLMSDTLYQFGAYSLQLLLTEEVFNRFPDATVGDLHLLRALAMSDDVIAYIFVKTKWAEAQFDQESQCPFEELLAQADTIGQCFFGTREWWMGVRNRRIQSTKSNQQTSTVSWPSWGATLQFHVKGSQGANCRSDVFFQDDRWCLCVCARAGCCVGVYRPLFDELLLLTAAEVRREFRDCSTVVMNYSRNGNEVH